MTTHLLKPNSRETSFDTALDEAIRLQSEVRETHRLLADTLTPDRVVEQQLAALMSSRDRAVFEVGCRVLEWVGSGGTISLQVLPPPTTNPTTVPFPHPVEDSLAPPTEPDPEPEPMVVEATPPPPKVEAPAPPRPRRVSAYVTPDREDPPAPLPPPRPPTPSTSRPPTRMSLDALKEVFGSGQARQFPHPEEMRRRIREILRSLPSLEAVAAEDRHASDVVPRLLDAVDSNEKWLDVPREVQKALVGYCAAIARHIQGNTPHSMLTAEVSRTFSPLTTFSKTYRPGFVRGLMREHEPVTGHWLEDARRWREVIERECVEPEFEPPPPAEQHNPEKLVQAVRSAVESGDNTAILAATVNAVTGGVGQQDPRLVRLLLDHVELLEQSPKLKALRKAIRTRIEEEVEAESAEDSGPLTAWPHLDFTRGKTAIILGGDPRSEVKERVRDAFQFDTVEWPYADQRRIEKVASQVRSGSVGVVIFIARLAGHRHQDIVMPACKEAGIPFIIVRRGYGVSSIRQEMERALGLVQAATGSA